MSALKTHQLNVLNDDVTAQNLIGRLLYIGEKQDRLPGGEAELELVREQIDLLRRFREIQRQRIKLVEDRIDEIESQQQDAAAGH
jgi:chaperonin cofactor prefoldin